MRGELGLCIRVKRQKLTLLALWPLLLPTQKALTKLLVVGTFAHRWGFCQESL